MTDQEQLPATPGWFADPAGSGRQRWFDGSIWSTEFQDAPTQPSYMWSSGSTAITLSPKPKGAWWRKFTVLGAAVLVAFIVLAVIGYASENHTKSPIAVSGSLVLTDSANDNSSACDLTDTGYEDIISGAEVQITDDAGKTLTLTSLGDGVAGGGQCTFTFSASVPAGKKFYKIEVTHRGFVTFPEDEMTAPELTLGS